MKRFGIVLLSLTYTFTYWFNVPVALKEFAPKGTSFYVQCSVSPGGQSGSTAFSLDATGSYNGTVPVQVQAQATQAAKTYRCSIPQGNQPNGALFVVPKNLSAGVGGPITIQIQREP
jgi:hypothetical protein